MGRQEGFIPNWRKSNIRDFTRSPSWEHMAAQRDNLMDKGSSQQAVLTPSGPTKEHTATEGWDRSGSVTQGRAARAASGPSWPGRTGRTPRGRWPVQEAGGQEGPWALPPAARLSLPSRAACIPRGSRCPGVPRSEHRGFARCSPRPGKAGWGRRQPRHRGCRGLLRAAPRARRCRRELPAALPQRGPRTAGLRLGPAPGVAPPAERGSITAAFARHRRGLRATAGTPRRRFM